MTEKITITNFIRKVRISNARRMAYYEKGKSKSKNRAKKYRTDQYVWKLWGNKKTYLVDKETGDRVVANPLSHGTPKDAVISGQDMYSQNLHPMSRNKIMTTLHDFFLAQFKLNLLQPFKEEDYPLIITGELFAPYYQRKNNHWDVDNFQFPFVKAFHDALKIGGYIIDDHRGLISQPLCFKYTPSKNDKMVIKFTTDNRKVWKDKSKFEI